MDRFSANLTMLFTEVPFLERFARARKAGFRQVEFQFPYDFDLDDVQSAVRESDQQVVLFNLPAGHWNEGERGIAVLPDRQTEFKEGVERALEYALATDCRKLNCLAGKLPANVSEREAWQVLKENVAYAAGELNKHGIRLLVEPCNSFDIPGFFLDSVKAARLLLNEVGRENLGIQFDFYHVQRMQGELMATFADLKDEVGHIQIADTPGRHQPGTGEINYRFVLDTVQKMGYQGVVGLEYIPLGTSEDSLQWLTDYLREGTLHE